MVKCSLCGEKAIAIIPYARLRLCKKHLMEYVERKVERALKRYKLVNKGWHVLVAVSGGKDSSTLLRILSKLSKKYMFKLTALYIDLGIRVYSDKSKQAVVKLVEQTSTPLIVVNVKEALGYSVPELAWKTRRPVCSVCGVVKRYILNATAIELGAHTIALGHNLDDLIAYVLKEFINQNLGQISKLGPKTETIDGLAIGRIRPLYEVYERESLLYVLASKTPFLPDECPHVRRDSLEFVLKEQLNKLEEKFPGIKMSLARRLALNIDKYPQLQQELSKCKACGLIASGQLCSLCKLTKQALGEPMGPKLRVYIREKINELFGKQDN